MSTLGHTYSNFRFLVRGVRWVELTLSALIVFFTRAVADLEFDWRPVAIVFCVGYLWNLGFWYAGRRHLLLERGLEGTRLLVWSWVIADVTTNLLIIMFTGLTSSPFMFFLVFPVILSTIALGKPKHSYGVALGSAFGLGALWAMDRAGSIPHFPAYSPVTDASFMEPNVAAASFFISAAVLCTLVYTIFRFRPNFFVFQEGYKSGQFRIQSLRPGSIQELRLEDVESVGPEDLLEELVQNLTLCEDITLGAAVVLPAGDDTMGGTAGAGWHSGLTAHRVISTTRRQVIPTWAELDIEHCQLFQEMRSAQTGDLFEGPFAMLQSDGLFTRFDEADSYLATPVSQNGRAVVIIIAALRHPVLSRDDVLVHLLNMSSQLRPLLAAETRLSEMRGELSSLHDQNEVLSRANKLQSDFVSIASHELKTPLTAIGAYTDALVMNAERPNFPERQEFLGVIRHETDRLLRMVNRILDFSQIEFGNRQLHRANISLPELVEGVVATMRPQFEERRLNVEMDFPDSLPRVDVDPDLMRQVFVNLLGNAAKFGPEGSQIAATARERASTIEISVKDQGPGIPESEVQNIFKQFYRVKNKQGEAVDGSGLGLTIVRNIIEVHGGRIEVDGGHGSGATFHFTIPKEQCTNETRETVLGDVARRPEFQHLLRLLVRMVADVMECKIVSVMLLSADRSEMYIQVAYGLEQDVVKKSTAKVGEGIAGRVASTGRALLIENVEELDGRNVPNHPQYETNSLLSVPLRMNDEIVGVINCNNKTSGEVFYPDDLSLLLTLTEKVTEALGRALRFEDSRNELQRTVGALQALVDLQSTDTQPNRRMVRYAMELGRRLGLTRKQILSLQYACVVHDVGMIKVGWDVMKKPGPLNSGEVELVRQHPNEGVELVEPFLGADDLDEAIRYHHERMDGTGYPAGLSGEHIPLSARIVAIVDAYDSMTSPRPYRAMLGAVEAATELINSAGTQFDPEIVRMFVDILAENGEINRQDWTHLKESDPCLRPASLS